MKSIIGTLIATLRFTVLIAALFIMMIIIWIASWFNFKVKNIPLSGWLTRALALFINFVLNVKVHIEDRSLFYTHQGFIFPNHTTFIDILVVLTIMPVRFLAMEAVGTMPFIGSIARSIGCVFVNRKNKASRTAAREALKGAPKYPPMILYPEGGIQPPPTESHRFDLAHLKSPKTQIIHSYPACLFMTNLISFFGPIEIHFE